MAKKKQLTPAAAFRAVVRAALDHYHEPDWLAANSPLAEVYFLGNRLAADATGDEARGRALQGLLRDAWARFWPGELPGDRDALLAAADDARRRDGNSGPVYYFLLLELRFFRAYFPSDLYPVQATDIPIFLSVSTSRFFVHLEEAIEQLADHLLRLAQPALRPERPRPPVALLGRAAVLAACRSQLLDGHSATITGVAGVGKTALAATIAAGWPSPATFWYTFLPGLSDNLPALLFGLGHFIQQWIPSALWQQLTADQGQVRDAAQLLAILRADLEQLQAHQPLLCFDEVDILRTSDGEPRSAAHIQLLTFLEGLSAATAVLLVGQSGYVDTAAHYTLNTLDEEQTAGLLREAGIRPLESTVARVQQVTGGLPRLIELVIALLESGDSLVELEQLHRRADVRPLFSRLWRRLDADEHELLAALSVLRRPVPVDVIARVPALEKLRRRRVVHVVAGEVAVLSYFRGLIYEALPAEQREAAHVEAARLRAVRGDYTAAAHHFHEAGDAVAAIEVWFPHRQLEIQRGHSGAAQTIFRRLSPARLPAPTAKQLRLIQNQLDLLEGNAARVSRSMALVEWDVDDIYAAEAYRQMGEANFMIGQTESALETYGRALIALGRYADAATDTFSRRSQMYIDLGEMTAARAEALRARTRLLLLEGMLAFNEANYDRAGDEFAEALAATASLDAPDLAAQAHEWLAATAIMRGDVATAEYHCDEALDYYRRIGNRVKMEGIRADLAGMYLNVRAYERVIEPSLKALGYFESIGHERWISSIASNLAEAFVELGRLDEAMHYAQRVLQLENQRSRPYALYSVGLIHQRQGRADYAAVAFEDGLRVAQQNGDRYIEAYLQRNVGRLLRDTGRAAEAVAPFEAALDLFRWMSLTLEIEETARELRALSA